jgi:hypothetical protein
MRSICKFFQLDGPCGLLGTFAIWKLAQKHNAIQQSAQNTGTKSLALERKVAARCMNMPLIYTPTRP